jgi:single-stranded-DNA-specific exonuclease
LSPLATAHRQIRLRPQKPKIATQIASAYQLSNVASRVLAARGFTPGDELTHFLEPTLKEGLPHPSQLLNLDAACQLIAEVVQQGKSIAICCDFDVDGLSGGSQVAHFLRSAGAKVQVFVPDRFADGYGLNETVVRSICDSGFSLLITIDFGTTNEIELGVAKELGLSTIVVDHHHVGSHQPPCDVFINPQQPSCGFSGGVLSAAGLAWYLIAGLRPVLNKALPTVTLPEARSYLDLACLGTICDMVPLRGPNRVIAKRGLETLAATKREGLMALKRVIGCRETVSCYDVSFGIGPRLNAAGRMVHGEVVVDLLTTSDRTVSERLAGTLNRLNAERQETELKVKERAVQQLEARYQGTGLPSALVVWDKHFHTGVIGIVAQRLVEMFYRPAIVMGLDSEGIFKGSVRGIRGFSVVGALESVGTNLLKFGGHEGAGGFSVEERKIPAFVEAFISECELRLRSIDSSPSAEADTEIGLADLSQALVEEFKRLAPFGMGNPNPQLLARKVKVLAVRQLKSAHLKATVSDGAQTLSALLWRQTSHPALIPGNLVDIVFRPEVSSFNGRAELQLNLQAVQQSGS